MLLCGMFVFLCLWNLFVFFLKIIGLIPGSVMVTLEILILLLEVRVLPG